MIAKHFDKFRAFGRKCNQTSIRDDDDQHLKRTRARAAQTGQHRRTRAGTGAQTKSTR